MTHYDRSYDALFRPGRGTDYFQSDQLPGFASTPAVYSHASAWWAAEFCRLTYRIDDQRQRGSRVGTDIQSLLDRIGYRIATVLTDPATSSLAVCFSGNQSSRFAAAPGPDVLVFCGSNEALDWKMNMQAVQQQWLGMARVHSGFLKSYTSLAERLADSVPSGRSLLLAGHSLGAALATLASVDLFRKDLPASACYSFGSPRIGNPDFVALLSGLPVYRLVNGCDIVTGVPASFGVFDYVHGQSGIYIDPQGDITTGLADEEIQRRQLAYIPELRKYATLATFVDRIKTLPVELPRYLADHAIVNYRNRLAAQLAMVTGRSP